MNRINIYFILFQPLPGDDNNFPLLRHYVYKPAFCFSYHKTYIPTYAYGGFDPGAELTRYVFECGCRLKKKEIIKLSTVQYRFNTYRTMELVT